MTAKEWSGMCTRLRGTPRAQKHIIVGASSHAAETRSYAGLVARSRTGTALWNCPALLHWGSQEDLKLHDAVTMSVCCCSTRQRLMCCLWTAVPTVPTVISRLEGRATSKLSHGVVPENFIVAWVSFASFCCPPSADPHLAPSARARIHWKPPGLWHGSAIHS